MRRCPIQFFACLLFVGLLWGHEQLQATSIPIGRIDEQRQLFIDALQRIEAGESNVFATVGPTIKQYPLYPYLEHADLMSRLDHLSPADVIGFSERYPDIHLGSRLRQAWLIRQAKHQNWKGYLAAYEPSSNTTLQCHALWAEYQQDQDIAPLRSDISKMWTVGHSLPEACDKIFTAWYAADGVDNQIAWSRIYLTMSERSYKLASYLKRFLPESDRVYVEQWINLRTNPEQLESTKWPLGPGQIHEVIFTDVMLQYADSAPQEAAAYWDKMIDEMHLSEADASKITQTIALHLALSADPNAEQWIQKIPIEVQSDQIQEWRIRTALKQGDWFGILRGVAQLNDNLRTTPRWQYWRARALEAQGAQEDATAVYTELSENRDYYGFLSSDRLTKRHVLSHSRAAIDPQMMIAISNRAGMMRAYELMILNREVDARREWYHELSQMNVVEKMAAARVAQRMGWHDLAIYTMAKTGKGNDIPLRFPLAFYRSIYDEADKNKLEPAWIFAVARQESQFKTDARSSAGAMGLMQLMPSTAKEIAKKLNMPQFSQWDLIQADVNLKIGTAYLRELYDGLNENIVLATAAYNAGPNRVGYWIPKEPMEADRWIESIPFYETRQYVMNVLTFYSIYQHLLGNETNLIEVMKPIRTLDVLEVQL